MSGYHTSAGADPAASPRHGELPPGGVTPAPAPDPFRARWEAALADLELDVERAEAILASDHLPVPDRGWRPPAGLGPIPAPLRRRAELLLERQTEVTRRVAEALVSNRRHSRAVTSMRAGAPTGPVYVDTAG